MFIFQWIILKYHGLSMSRLLSEKNQWTNLMSYMSNHLFEAKFINVFSQKILMNTITYYTYHYWPCLQASPNGPLYRPSLPGPAFPPTYLALCLLVPDTRLQAIPTGLSHIFCWKAYNSILPIKVQLTTTELFLGPLSQVGSRSWILKQLCIL